MVIPTSPNNRKALGKIRAAEFFETLQCISCVLLIGLLCWSGDMLSHSYVLHCVPLPSPLVITPTANIAAGCRQKGPFFGVLAQLPNPQRSCPVLHSYEAILSFSL